MTKFDDVRLKMMREKGVRIPHAMSDAVAIECWEWFFGPTGPNNGLNSFQIWLDKWPVNGMPPPPPPLPPELDVPHWAVKIVAKWRQICFVPERVTDRMIYARLLEFNQLPVPGDDHYRRTVCAGVIEHLALEVPEK